MRVLQQPSTIKLPLGTEQIDYFIHPRVGRIPDRAEVFEGAQHVVVPPGWKRELQPGWVEDLTGALTSEQLWVEDVLFTPSPTRDEIRAATDCALVCQHSFLHVDRGREGEPHG